MDQSLSDLLLSVDFSLDRLDVQLRQSEQVIWPHQAYANNWPGYEALQADLLVALEQAGADRLVAVGESTGPYWWHLFYQLSHDAKLADYKAVSGISGNLSSVGSDTLANLMTFWAEEFKRQYPNVNIQIQAAGSSTAPPALTEGTSNLGPMSRKMNFMITTGADYYFSSTLYGHDTSYGPNGETANPRKDYQYVDADQAVNQPKFEFRFMLGVQYHFGR